MGTSKHSGRPYCFLVGDWRFGPVGGSCVPVQRKILTNGQGEEILKRLQRSAQALRLAQNCASCRENANCGTAFMKPVGAAYIRHTLTKRVTPTL